MSPSPSLPLHNFMNGQTPTSEVCNKKIEDYRPGYPRYTALLSAHDPFLICRRFTRLRARLLLLKQDRLSQLEAKLDELDQNEKFPLFLGVSRRDANSERAALVAEIDSQLEDYDRFVERTRRMLALSPPTPRDVESLRNWLEGNKCIAEEECTYIKHNRDLVSLVPDGDRASVKLEALVEQLLIKLWRGFRKRRHHDISDDLNVYIYSGPCIRVLARTLVIILIALLLFLPVLLCTIIDETPIRIIVYMICTLVYLLVVSLLIKSRTMELVLAGATYATILIVFFEDVSGSKG